MNERDERDAHMPVERLEAIVAAYGADERRWPEAERDAAARLAARGRGGADVAENEDPRAEQLGAALEQAAALDELLALAEPVPEPSHALRARVLAGAPGGRPARSWGERLAHYQRLLWPFSPLWQPMAALTAAAALGVLLGTTLPDSASASDATDISEIAFGSDVEWDPSGEWEQP